MRWGQSLADNAVHSPAGIATASALNRIHACLCHEISRILHACASISEKAAVPAGRHETERHGGYTKWLICQIQHACSALASSAKRMPDPGKRPLASSRFSSAPAPPSRLVSVCARCACRPCCAGLSPLGRPSRRQGPSLAPDAAAAGGEQASAFEPCGRARLDRLDKTEFSSLFSTPRFETVGHFMSLTLLQK